MENLKEFWEQVLTRLEPLIKRTHFITWFKNTAILDMDETTMMIGVPNIFAYDWLANRYRGEILKAVSELKDGIKEIKYEVHSSLDNKDDTRGVDVKFLLRRGATKSVRKLPKKQEVKLVEGITSKLLNPKYTLSNFVIGPANRLAHAACSSVAKTPGGEYNPLFIYGGVGLGKTHLLQAVGNEILKRDCEKIVVYIPSERFVNEIVEAIGNRYTKQFRKRYRQVDCLMIDDIQFLGNKERTQEEFFHTFNELYDANKQIIISSDRPPTELLGLDDRLRSRFGMGMIADVQFPDYETRLAILHAKCREKQVLLPNEVLEFIAENAYSSIRELEGILLQAIAECQLEDRTPTVRYVAGIIKKLHKKRKLIGIDEKEISPEGRVNTISDVINIVASFYNLQRVDLVGSVRKREIMMPRQICMYLIRKELNQSYESIGKEFGGRNHTTVMHACDRIARILKKDRKLLRDVSGLKREMGL